MPQTRERLILNAVKLHYKGAPTVSVFKDSSLATTFTAPSHSTYKTKTFSVPAGTYGHIFDVTTNSTDMGDYELLTVPPSAYREQLLWHFYEIVFSGSVNVSLFLDEEERLGSGQYGASLSTTKSQDTQKVYMPALSYGRVPHVTNLASDTGEVYSWNPVQLPARFYSGIKSVSEIKITYRGNINVCLYMDGEKIGDEIQLSGEKDNSGREIYVTESQYIETGVIGRVFQWAQVSGTGDIISLETDAHIIEEQPVSIPEPQ